MRKRLAILPLMLTLAWAQEPAFRADVSLVEIDVQVIGKAGLIEGLGLSDFAVNDDRHPVSIRYCLREQTPLDLVLMFDLSQGMAPKLDQLRAASEMAMGELRERDRVAVMSFDERARIELPPSGDLNEIRRRTRIGMNGASFSNGFPSVLSAATEAAAYLRQASSNDHQRRAILMFTADIGGGKQESHTAAANAFWNDDVLLSALVIPNRLTRFTHDDNPLHFRDVQILGQMMKFSPFDSIDELAGLTGGEVVFKETGVIGRMRKRYRLYYDRPEGTPGQTRRVEVRLSSAAEALYPDARVITRRSYVIPKRAQ